MCLTLVHLLCDIKEILVLFVETTENNFISAEYVTYSNQFLQHCTLRYCNVWMSQNGGG
jgi:hypothetical protein